MAGNDAGVNSILRKFTQMDVNLFLRTPKKAHLALHPYIQKPEGIAFKKKKEKKKAQINANIDIT